MAFPVEFEIFKNQIKQKKAMDEQIVLHFVLIEAIAKFNS